MYSVWARAGRTPANPKIYNSKNGKARGFMCM
jgi:hypothetical protein